MLLGGVAGGGDFCCIHSGLYQALHERLGGYQIKLPSSSKGVTIAGMSPSNIRSAFSPLQTIA
jgi:hypothetical protein